MQENLIPRIQVDYLLQDDDLQYVPVFEQVGNEYVASRSEEEAPILETVEAGGRVVNIKLGRAVLDAVSSEHVHHQADMLHLHVEDRVDNLVGEPGFAHRHLSGVRTFNNFSESD